MRKNSCSDLYHIGLSLITSPSLWETNAEVKHSNEHELNYLQTEGPLWLPICDLLVLHYVC